MKLSLLILSLFGVASVGKFMPYHFLHRLLIISPVSQVKLLTYHHEAQELNGSEVVDLETPSSRALKSSCKFDCGEDTDCDKGEKCKKGQCVVTGKSRNVSKRSRSKSIMMHPDIALNANDLIVIDSLLCFRLWAPRYMRI